MDEVGDLIKYKVDFPGAVDPDGVDARNANKIGNIFADSAKKFGYNLSGSLSEVRMWSGSLSGSVFKTHVLDKQSESS